MAGLHHVTAICGRAERNLAFYTRALGLRLVKQTVNFDDPGTYHLYYGDEVGHPGTILTFFPCEYAPAGRAGIGQAEQIRFRVPASGLGYWTHRFLERGVVHEQPIKRFGETTLLFVDPDVSAWRWSPLRAPRRNRLGAPATSRASMQSADFTVRC